MSATDFANLRAKAREIRKRFLTMHFNAKSGHIGSGLSDIDILTYLYSSWLRPHDRFLLSKGHAASSLYATLNRFGFISDSELETYYKDGTKLPGHPAARAREEIPAATGSLGHGLPIAAGMAYAHKWLRKDDARITVLLSDGECNEGSVWEAAMFSAHHKLSNLTVIVDCNGIQGFGFSRDVMGMEPFLEKWKAFGFDAREAPGHDFESLHAAISAPRGDAPRCVIARTVKGKGVSFMENKMEWHYWPMSAEQYQQAMSDVEKS